MPESLITWFPDAPAAADIPDILPSPFSHMPHPLAEQAALMLQTQLSATNHCTRDFILSGGGKMFGVLVVRDKQDRIGFLSAFSGMMNGQWLLPGFVPPLFNIAEQDAFLPAGSDALAVLTQRIEQLETSVQRSSLIRRIADTELLRNTALIQLKQRHKAAKNERKQQRLTLQNLTDNERKQGMADLALASQRHKREATDAGNHWQEQLQSLRQQLDDYEQQITQLKNERTEMSRQLHQQVFSTYILTNHLHEKRCITDCFKDKTPPAGSGDCAAPKLLQYACKHDLHPIALAEFWWGASPATGIRHHGHYYPACRGKCRPILPFMLHGLKVEPEPCHGIAVTEAQIKILYEDSDILVINKPAGLMSAPGKEVEDSVLSRLRQSYPDTPELTLVHRLDMATSGLLLAAKNLKAHKRLQRQFIEHRIEKRYEALLAKALPQDPRSGEINLPLRVDLDDRPRQMICDEHGKPAQTLWHIIGNEGEFTRVCFEPKTGRTHQLRVHASHANGLNAAIVGDALYGQGAERLMLHAQYLSFTHPFSHKIMVFELPAPF